jgi:glycosyltransferase involved in cell wall biosynthesis
MSKGTQRCVIFGYFIEGQPGYLDFSYRVKALAEKYQVILVSNIDWPIPELSAPNIAHHCIVRKQGLLGWLVYLWKCWRWIAASEWDIVVLLHTAVAPLSILLGDSKPVILYWNEHPTHLAPPQDKISSLKDFVRLAARYLMYSGARMSTLVMPIGEAHHEDLLIHRCKPERLEMIYMGVDDAFRVNKAVVVAPKTNEEPAVRLLYIGSVAKERGRDVMLEGLAIATSRLGNLCATLTMVGAPAEQVDYCTSKAAELGIASQVRVLGRVAGKDIPKFFTDADVGLCLWEDKPWYRFNPPTKLFEYLVAGLPVLASNIRTHTQYVEHGRTGLIFDYGAEGLADVIIQISTGKVALGELKAAASEEGVKYLWSRLEPKFLASVERLIR